LCAQQMAGRITAMFLNIPINPYSKHTPDYFGGLRGFAMFSRRDLAQRQDPKHSGTTNHQDPDS